MNTHSLRAGVSFHTTPFVQIGGSDPIPALNTYIIGEIKLVRYNFVPSPLSTGTEKETLQTLQIV